MKKAILLSGILAVGAALAGDVTSGNAVGVLDVSIKTTESQPQVLVSVPFVGFGAGVAVSVKDMVKTSDLVAGSKLYVPTGTKDMYDTWTLNEDGTWHPDTTVEIGVDQADESSSANQDAATAKRGDAFWIEPKFKDSATQGNIFLLGQCDNSACTSVVKPGWNLIGNASVDKKVLSIAGNAGDEIVVQVNNQLRYYNYSASTDKPCWRYRENGEIKVANPTIEAGKGLWYRNVGSVDLEINWQTLKGEGE